MFGCRAKIGFITPAGDSGGISQYYRLLPEGVDIILSTCAVSRVVPEDIEKAFSMYPAAAEHLATQECDVIFAGGSPLFSYMGYERTQQMLQRIRGAIGKPVITDIDAHFDAFRELSAKRIVIATPYEEARTEDRKRLCEQMGFQVLSTRSLGLQRRVEIQQQPPFTAYRLAKQAFLEAPEADAIYVSCPEWPILTDIDRLEKDTGKPVVAHVTADIWALLRILRIKEPIKGYGCLLEKL